MSQNKNFLTAFFLVTFLISGCPVALADVEADLLEEEVIDLKVTKGESQGFFDKIFNIFNKDNPKGNILLYQYNQDMTYSVKLQVGVSTVINIPENEKIIFLSYGDKNSFKVLHDSNIRNLISIQTLINNSESNLIIKTDVGSVYNFFLTSRLEEKEKPNFTVFVVKDKDQEEMVREKILLRDLKMSNDYIKKVDSLEKLNTSYIIKGDKTIAPKFVYDDGKWTYFDFGKKFVSDRLPNVYKITDQFDSVVNTRTEGNLIVAQSLGIEGWTLKNGDKFVCIRPEKNLAEVYEDKRFK